MTCLCADCGDMLPADESLAYTEIDGDQVHAVSFAVHQGEVYAFCSVECCRHWLDDSQEGAALKEMLR